MNFKTLIILGFTHLNKFLSYPFKIKKRYEMFIGIFSMMINRVRDMQMNTTQLNLMRKNYTMMIHVCIIIPLLLGIVLSANSLYWSWDRYSLYIKQVFAPLGGSSFFDTLSSLFTRLLLAVKYQPVEFSDFKWLIFFYLITMLGAWFMERFNPIFKEQERIQEILTRKKMFDENGFPWFVVWTPEFIYFDTYDCNPDSFVKDRKFWNTINFKPSQSISFKDDTNKFIIAKKYELDDKIVFKF